MSGQGASNSSKAVLVGDELFKRIHQLQVAMIQQTSKVTVNSYRRQLVELFESGGSFGTLPSAVPEDLNNLVEFLTFPILACIKRLLTDCRQMMTKNSDAATPSATSSSSSSSKERLLREFSDLSELLLSCLRYVLEHVDEQPLRNVDLFYEVLNLCSILLSLRSKSAAFQISPTLSEELLVECLKLVQVLFGPNSNRAVFDSFYRFSNLTSLGLLVSVFLDLLVQSNSFQVRLEALEAFKSISQYKLFEQSSLSPATTTTSSLDARIGTIFASFLPGICIKLVQGFLFSQNLKLLNHKLICCSIQLLSHVLVEIVGDDLLDEARTKAILAACMPQPSDRKSSSELSSDVKAMIVDRTSAEWLAQSAQKVCIILERLFSLLVLNDNQQVQTELVKFSVQICNRCYFTLNKFLPSCLKVLVTLVDSDDIEASQLVSQTLETMASKETDKNRLSSTSTSQFTMMSSCVDELLIELPRIMNRQFSRDKEIDDQVRVHHLKLLGGYLRLIGGKDRLLKEFLVANLANLNSLLQALISCVWFDYKSLNNFYEVTVIDSDKSETINASRMSSYAGLKTYLDDKNVYEELRKICAYLGRTDALHLIVDELFTNDMLYLQRHQNRTEIMFLINLMLTSFNESTSSQAPDRHVVKLVLDNFLDADNQHSPRPEPSDEQVGGGHNLITAITPTTRRNRHIIQTCLVLEAIATLSKCQESSRASHSFLISTIFFTLENYLNPNLLIRAVSAVCLSSLAKNLSYQSTQHLLSANYDYIMNDLILRSFNQLRARVSSQKNDAQVQGFSAHVYILCSLLQISNPDLVPYLDRLINDYMVAVETKSYDTDLLDGMCKIVYQMAKSMRSWYPVKVNFIDSNNNLTLEVDDLFRINLKDYTAKKKKPEYTASFSETIAEIEDQMVKFKRDQEFLAKEQPSLDEEQDELGDDEDEEEKSKKKTPPMHVQLQTKCLTLCSHLISHPYRQIRIAVIDNIRELSVNLAEHADDFLPIVHKLWSPICKRFLMDDLVVKGKIVQLLFELSVLCPDFLTSRFGKEFLPYLCQFMSEQAKASAKHKKLESSAVAKQPRTSDPFSQKTRSSDDASSVDATYIYSQAYKLQLAILNNLDKMCVLFEIKELELESLIDACVTPYLDKKQPKRLQQSAIVALKNISLIDPDIVWMSLHGIIPFGSRSEDQSLIECQLYAPDLCSKHPYRHQQQQPQNQLAREVLADLVILFNQL